MDDFNCLLDTFALQRPWPGKAKSEKNPEQTSSPVVVTGPIPKEVREENRPGEDSGLKTSLGPGQGSHGVWEVFCLLL